MKTKLLALLLLVAILTTMLASCEVLEFVNHMLNIFGPGDDSDTNIDLDINIGGTTAHVHTEGVLPATESTCTTHGLTEGRYCTSCEKVLVPQEEAPLKAHTYDNSVDKYCNVCGYERDIDCSHQGTTEFLPATESTCTEAGLTQGVKCTLCGETVVAQETLPLKDHVSSDWIIDEDATTEKEGLKHIECLICGTTTLQSIIPMRLPESMGLEYTLNSDKNSYSVTGIGTCTDTRIVIPETYDGKPVTVLAKEAFYGNSSIKSVYISDSITTIENIAISKCSSLEYIWIGASVNTLGENLFGMCDALTTFEVDKSNEKYQSIDGNLYSKSGDRLIHYANGKLEDTFVVPSNVKIIGYFAFSGSNLVNIVLPEGLTTLDNYAFSSCDLLETVNIPDSVTSFGQYTFMNCKSLKSINIPEGVIWLGNSIFYCCFSLQEIKIPSTVKGFGEGAFWGCSLIQTIVIPDGVSVIPYNAFLNCHSLLSVTIPSSVTKIDHKAFDDCDNLTSISFLGTVEQWSAISKGNYWDIETPDYTVYCTDGQIAKDGTVTYK